MLEICLCKPAIYKLKILGGGKCESYKSMGGTTKTGGSKREGITIFDLNLVGGNLGGNYVLYVQYYVWAHSVNTFAKFSEKLTLLPF